MFSLSKTKGFTLAELMVSVAIMVMITATVLFNQKSYNDVASIKNFSQTLALDIRQMQVFGLSVREFSPGTSNFSVGYGVAINRAGINDVGRYYTQFADLNHDGIYSTLGPCVIGGTSECLSRVSLPSNVSTTQVCIIPSSGPEDCTSADRVDITFVRPDPSAIFVFTAGGSVLSPGSVKGMHLVMTTTAGLTKNLYVYKTGQISVQ